RALDREMLTGKPAFTFGDQPGKGALVAYFGYGSLVNRATLRTDIVDIVPARLVVWRRYWRPRPDMPGFPAALLTVRREPGCYCDGVLIVDRAENLPRSTRGRRAIGASGWAGLSSNCPIPLTTTSRPMSTKRIPICRRTASRP